MITETISDIQTFEPTRRTPYQLFVAELKAQIKEDAVKIPAQKKVIRDLQRTGDAASSQSHLASMRTEARARLLIYGLMRGRTWDQIEPKHEMTSNLRFAIKRIFKDVQSFISTATGVEVLIPETVTVVLV